MVYNKVHNKMTHKSLKALFNSVFCSLLLSLLSVSAWAQDATAPAGDGAGAPPAWQQFLIPLGFMFVVFYFLLIRPQQKQQKERNTMLTSLKRGDHIVTQGGFHVKVESIDDQVLTVELAPNVKAKINREGVLNIKGQNQSQAVAKGK